ncbi:hypothetical protein [Agrobacterium tumefaciens]|uniref:hypothetical protein n=1 Tax=Agrobacterium tumefaciens TaxID=358 RepID=UPI00157191DD|nr:hypothetical protein [Agrobacterium tumefaciens]WCK02997.1 hypothetical protein G6L31_003895 [Agrobacterium tumefaciens]
MHMVKTGAVARAIVKSACGSLRLPRKPRISVKSLISGQPPQRQVDLGQILDNYQILPGGRKTLLMSGGRRHDAEIK